MKFKALFLILFLLSSTAWAGVTFDGTDDFVSVGTLGNTGSTFDTLGLTYSCWVKTTQTTTAGLGGSLNTGTTTSLVFQINRKYDDTQSTGYLRIFARQESGTALSGSSESATTVNDGAWHHLVFVINTGDTINIYFDGVSQVITYQGSSQNDLTATANLGFNYYIGAFNNRGTVAQTINGTIDDIAMWLTPLSAAEVSLLYTSKVRNIPLQIQPSSLVGYWKLDDQADGTSGDADTFRDMSANANTGTGNDGANNTGLTAVAGQVLTYP